ncbi:hypothetical protein ILUMI_17340 [Ignelater luminosus]|uniref:ABC-2 type transporter transmembrane domain-containing protein n=1 Tax=Ignelater luminosus TaxID=2038154 RepID=A0A8K0CK20_IGNLU|nr:hypothetical protein ILUMI_17340 [Ignelater luminosus]
MQRNIGIVLFIFAIPIMQVILSCMASVGDLTGLKIAIVNYEANYTNTSYQACQHPPLCRFYNLSCRYLEYLNDAIQKLYYPDPKSAIEAVKNSDVHGALYMSDNFTDALVARWALKSDVDEETLDQSEVKIWLDTADQQIKITLQQDLEGSYEAFFQDLIVKDCKSDSERFPGNPLSFKELFNTQ